MDAGYSSDWDSDEDEDKSEDDDLLFDAHAQTQDGPTPFDNAANAGWSPGGQAFGPPRLPPLASVPVYGLECVPEQTSRNGVPFMGRGTPADRARRAEWAAPAIPLLPRAIAMDGGCSLWMRPSRPFYASQPEVTFPAMDMSFTPMEIDVQPQVQVQFEQQEYAQQH